MEEKAVGIEALWRSMAAAQYGRYFLLKWMILLGAAQGSGLLVRFAVSPIFVLKPMSGFTVSIWISAVNAAFSGAVAGLLIFGWRWKVPMWIAVRFGAPLCWLVGPVIINRHQYVWLLVSLFVLAMEFLLLRGVRKWPAWWIVAFVLSMVASFGIAQWMPYALFTSMASRLGLPSWLNSSFGLNAAMNSFDLAIHGAALAWLMPPVAPSAPACQTVIRNE